MNDELFHIADIAHDSPRLAWIKRNRVETHHLPLAHVEDMAPWRATIKGKRPPGFGGLHVGLGETEEDAIADLADLLGIPLWNEEEFAATTAQQRTTKTT
jgi:hypothetical protein